MKGELDILDLKPIENVSTSTKIMEQLVDIIYSNELEPGVCLPSETKLAKSLGTSRSTIREALSGLKALGLIKSIPGRGNFIRESKIDYDWKGIVDVIKSKSGYFEALEARRPIEGEICRLAAEKQIVSAIEEIETALIKSKDVKSVDQFKKADYEFHLALAKASENNLFVEFIKKALLKLDEPYYNIIKLAEEIDDNSSVRRIFSKSYRNHEKIYRAIVNKDVPKAKENMLNHLESAREKFMKYYKKVNEETI